MTTTLLWFWDYDTQWGADRSRNPRRVPDWGPREFPNTDRLLELHGAYDVPACFAVVGAAALRGDRPYHDPAQVRRIHEAGHEVASHAFRHEWLPGLTGPRLRETLSRSKDALEQCIGAEVVTFVPPYNQPFDHAPALSVSLSERREALGNRTDLRRLCEALGECGYRLCRVVYQSLADRLRERVTGRVVERPVSVERIGGLACVRLNTRGGFADDTRQLVRSHLDDEQLQRVEQRANGADLQRETAGRVPATGRIAPALLERDDREPHERTSSARTSGSPRDGAATGVASPARTSAPGSAHRMSPRARHSATVASSRSAAANDCEESGLDAECGCP